MLSLTKYVEWMAFVSFDEHIFDVMDSIILAQFAYLDMKDVWQQEPMKIRDLIEKQSSYSMQMVPDGQDHDDFIKMVARSDRYGQIWVKNNVDTFDEKEHIQFGAMTLQIDEDHDLILFKGTDDSIVGWREDFMMSFTKTFSQTASLAYLESEIQPHKRYYVAGHSKGGHLAIYSTSQLMEDNLAHIQAIYDLDGPGLCKDVMDPELTARIDAITMRVIPQYCIVGNIFEPHFSNVHIVKSHAQGTMQHSLSSWQFDHNGLIEVAEEDPQSVWISRSINDWMKNVNQEDRKIFVNQMFDAFSINGNVNFEEVKKGNLMDFHNLLMAFLRTDPVTKKTAVELPVTAIANSGPIVKKRLWERIKERIKK